jgi:hypothetical protein
MFGAHPFSVAMYAENDKVTSFSLVFANKGDLFSAKGGGEMHFDKDTPPAQAAMIVKKAMDKDLSAISATLTKTTRPPKKERFGEKAGRMNMQRWDWRGHSILLAEAEGEYVGIQIVTTAFRGRRRLWRTPWTPSSGPGRWPISKNAKTAMSSSATSRWSIKVPKATAPPPPPNAPCAISASRRTCTSSPTPARPALAAAPVWTCCFRAWPARSAASAARLIPGTASSSSRRSPNTSTRGVPLMWCLYSTKEFNDTANKRTKERKDVTDWAAWKTKVTAESAANSLPKDKETATSCSSSATTRTPTRLPSATVGATLQGTLDHPPEAEQVSQQRFYVVGFFTSSKPNSMRACGR